MGHQYLFVVDHLLLAMTCNHRSSTIHHGQPLLVTLLWTSINHDLALSTSIKLCEPSWTYNMGMIDSIHKISGDWSWQDIYCSNGIVHSIKGVLMPAGIPDRRRKRFAGFNWHILTRRASWRCVFGATKPWVADSLLVSLSLATIIQLSQGTQPSQCTSTEFGDAPHLTPQISAIPKR